MPAPQNLTLAAIALALLVAPVAAFGQGTEEQQQACTPDAVKLCSDSIPDIPKTTACMKAHFAQLSPRCQSAFNDATGGKAKAKPTTRTATSKPETKTATRKAEPRNHTATRDERRRPDRDVAPSPEREASAPRLRSERQAALPPAPAGIPPVGPSGYPPFPSPDAPLVEVPRAVVAPGSPGGQIAQACRDGLIDSFTCRTTVPALLGGPVN